MKRKYYLIDTENVGDRWIDYIRQLKKGHILVVFYTKNHSRLLEECYLKQRYNKKIRWVECEAGNNALDQQLMGVLSYLIATHPDAEYSIFSNDKDYKNIIEFWKQRGLDINRIGFCMDKKKDKKKAEGDGSANGQPILEKLSGQIDAMENAVFEGITEEQAIEELAKAVSMEDLGNWHALLVSLFGQESGRRHYMQLKDNEERRQELSQYLLSDGEERNVYLVAFLYRYHHLDVSKAELAYQLVKAHSRKNKKAMKADFDKHFGKKTAEQTQYYKVVKPVVAILKGKVN